MEKKIHIRIYKKKYTYAYKAEIVLQCTYIHISGGYIHTCKGGERDIRIWQKRPTYLAKRDLRMYWYN
jgi:hypothetical protein